MSIHENIQSELIQGHRSTVFYLFIYFSHYTSNLSQWPGRILLWDEKASVWVGTGGIHLCRRSSRTKVGVCFLPSVQAEFTTVDAVGFKWKDSGGEHKRKTKRRDEKQYKTPMGDCNFRLRQGRQFPRTILKAGHQQNFLFQITRQLCHL